MGRRLPLCNHSRLVINQNGVTLVVETMKFKQPIIRNLLNELTIRIELAGSDSDILADSIE